MTELATYSDRKKIREELERSEVEGVSLDPSIKCRCPECGQVHYRKKEAAKAEPTNE